MQLQKLKNSKQLLLYCFLGFLLFASYTVNFGEVADKNFFPNFERRPEGLVVGRLARASQDGIFSFGGMNGLNYKSFYSPEELEDPELVSLEYNRNLALQHDLYLLQKDLPEEFMAYKSQTGGQGIFFSVIQKFSPFDHSVNLQLFRAINALLVAFCFMLFIAWVFRNHGWITGFITFILIFFSQLLTMYGHSLWWAVWNFYIPFLTMLLILEKKHTNPNQYSDRKICLFIFIAVFAKCVFSGFEFITTTLVSAICPIVYYYVVEKKTVWEFIKFSFKVGVSMIFAVLAEMLVLVTQIASYEGSWLAGVHHIIYSYTRRTDVVSEAVGSYGEILAQYFKGNAFPLGFCPDMTAVYFGVVFLIVCVFASVVYLLSKKLNTEAQRLNVGLVCAAIFSILAPLSWFIIFKEHSYQHPHIDYFVWYLPTLPLGFVVIGQGISLIFDRIRARF